MALPEENKPPTRQPAERKNSLENLEHRLYSRTPPPLRHDEEFIGEERRIRISPEWTAEAERKESALYSLAATVMPWLKRLLIASVIFFLFTAGIALYGVWRGGHTISPQNISVDVIGPVGTAAGEEMHVEITIGNESTLDLGSVDLLVEFPDGTRKPGNLSEPLLRYRDALGPLPSGARISRQLSLVPFGEEEERQTIVVTAEYRPKDSNAIFSRKIEYGFSINSAPVIFTLGTPKEVNSDQTFEMAIALSSNSNVTQENLLVKAQYPFGFQFVESEPKPSFGTDTWFIGDFQPQGKSSILIRGKLQATNEEERTFRFSVGTQGTKDEKQLGTTFLSEAPSITVRKPFINLDLLVNGKQGETFVGRSGQTIRAAVTWGNNLTTKIVNLEVTAELIGNIYNQTSVSASNGFYDSTIGAVVWDQQKTPRFASVAPGESGTLGFSLAILPVAINPASFQNPRMTIKVTARGKRLDERGLSQDVVSVVQKEIKVATMLALSSRLLHNDGPFSNSGSIPPRAEQETTYTVVWSLSNASNKVAEAKVSAVLPSYVKWLGKVDPPSAQVVYNGVGGEILWSAGEIEADTGVNTPPREVSFQVSFLPSLGQVGTTPTIVGESTARGLDLFTGVEVSSNIRPSLTTRSLGDPGATKESGTVIK